MNGIAGTGEAVEHVIDISEAIDQSKWTVFQRGVAILAAIACIADGFDGQLIGFAIPALMTEWGVGRGNLVLAVAAGFLGMAIGGACGGYIGDRFGRRRAIIASVLVFGLCTFLIGFVDSISQLVALRFFAGLGLGGALPSSTTLVAEFTPARRRTLAVSAAIICVPFGGMLAGLTSGLVLPVYGWRALFWLGGAATLALCALFAIALPESPRYLARHTSRWPELRGLLRRMSLPNDQRAAFQDTAKQKHEESTGLRGLFADQQARNTLALWLAFFLCIGSIYSVFAWLPAMLAAQGLGISVATQSMTAYNFGGVLGAVILALLITRWGSRWPLIIACAGGAISAFFVRGAVGGEGGATWALIAGIGLHGFFVNSIQATMYAVCAHVYPTPVRTTGAAYAAAVGRVGAILSAFSGIASAGGASFFFGLLGFALLGVMLALAALKMHIPQLRSI